MFVCVHFIIFINLFLKPSLDESQVQNIIKNEENNGDDWESQENGIDELEELLGIVRLKEERIEELEEALRESVRITAERERGLQQEETRRKNIMDKVR